jgi:hypothetical protein
MYASTVLLKSAQSAMEVMSGSEPGVVLGRSIVVVVGEEWEKVRWCVVLYVDF